MTITPEWIRQRRRLSRTALSIAVATGAYGLSFGALSTAAGLSVAQTCAMSMLIFTGGSQFALVGVLAGGGSGVSGTASAVLLGSRHLVYGASISPMLALRGGWRFLGAQLVIDESTAVALSGQALGTSRDTDTDRGDAAHNQAADNTHAAADSAGRLGFWLTGLGVFLFWNAATLVGAVAGTAIGDPRTFGLDAASPAAFLALLAPRLRGRPGWATALVAAAVAITVVPVVPAGVPVLIAALVPVVAVLARRGTDTGANEASDPTQSTP